MSCRPVVSSCESEKYFFDNARGGFRTGNLFVRQPDHAEQTAVVHDTLELPTAFQEACNGILVLHLLGDDKPAREGIETACRAWLDQKETTRRFVYVS